MHKSPNSHTCFVFLNSPRIYVALLGRYGRVNPL